MPFELCVTPAYFQKYINAVFAGSITKGIVIIYMDDLIIASIDFEEELARVLKVTSAHGLDINGKKSPYNVVFIIVPSKENSFPPFTISSFSRIVFAPSSSHSLQWRIGRKTSSLSVGFQWSKVQSAKFSILEHQMDPSSNFSSYRSTLKAAMWRSAGATDERQRIVVPFFSLLVKDLYFLNEGCSNK